jgi:hypothetical protein
MTQNYERRFAIYSTAAVMFVFAVVTTLLVFVEAAPELKVQVYKGDVVKFRWTPDNVFYSKTCTDYGTAIDQYGDNHPAYKVVIVCTSKNKVEFIPILIQPPNVVSSSQELLPTPIDDSVE